MPLWVDLFVGSLDPYVAHVGEVSAAVRVEDTHPKVACWIRECLTVHFRVALAVGRNFIADRSGPQHPVADVIFPVSEDAVHCLRPAQIDHEVRILLFEPLPSAQHAVGHGQVAAAVVIVRIGKVVDDFLAQGAVECDVL